MPGTGAESRSPDNPVPPSASPSAPLSNDAAPVAAPRTPAATASPATPTAPIAPGLDADQLDYLPLRLAAQRLGVSVDTVKRRLRAGQVRGIVEPRPQGTRWLVGVPRRTASSPATPPPGEADATPRTAAPPAAPESASVAAGAPSPAGEPLALDAGDHLSTPPPSVGQAAPPVRAEELRRAALEAENRALRQTLELLTAELEARRRETRELHILLERFQAHQLAAPVSPSPSAERAASAGPVPAPSTTAAPSPASPHAPPAPRPATPPPSTAPASPAPPAVRPALTAWLRRLLRGR